MFALSLDIRPTSGLTFRRLPSGILHISTYPFLPPTTMSGWLRRLLLMTTGAYPETDIKNPDYFALPPDYYVLGAYPTNGYAIHTTNRQGVRSFNFDAFSRIFREQGKDVYQLHTWEYLITKELTGYVMHEKAEALEPLRNLENYGCKIGKEGYAYLENISEVLPLEQKTANARPDVIVPAQDLIGHPANIYALYRYQYESTSLFENDLHELTPTPIKGFVPLQAGWPAYPIEIDYYTNGKIYLPASWVEVLLGNE